MLSCAPKHLWDIPATPNAKANPAMEFCNHPEYHGAVKSPLDCNSNL
jgi:hypothetical protein